MLSPFQEFYERPSPSPTDEIESAASSSGEKESNCEETNVSGASAEPHLPTIAVPTPLRPSTTVQLTIESSSGIVTEPGKFFISSILYIRPVLGRFSATISNSEMAKPSVFCKIPWVCEKFPELFPEIFELIKKKL